METLLLKELSQDVEVREHFAEMLLFFFFFSFVCLQGCGLERL